MLAEIISNTEVVAVSVITLFLIYVVVVYTLIFRNKRRSYEKRMRLIDAISAGVDNETLCSVEDFVNIYKGIYGINSNYQRGLPRVLRKYTVNLVSASKQDASVVKKRKEFINNIIKQIEAEIPFSNLPATERNLVLDIIHFIKENDEASATNKIEDLAGLIQVRQESLNRVEAMNKWSIPLAIIGSILTILFGIISIFK